MRFTLSCLALLATAMTVAADNVVKLAVPGDDDDGSGMDALADIRFRVVGINGSTTSYSPNCPASATPTTTSSASTTAGNRLMNCDMTFVSGPKTFRMDWEGETFERCDMGSKSATCYVTWTTTRGTSILGTDVDSSMVPVTTVSFTVTATDASVTPSSSASASASAKATATGSADASSTSASASNTENAAMGLPTGHAYFAAGGAAMALAVAIA
ncbi:hypothetical protein ANOM_000027 [Aspergillus nomiae NRRL 13137]|uniref:GPI anchored protein n=1 Tax=Aspergillus nomiae NRRL (strain ATCC 15546 / NRRL 13137 / CBS 260.88 / M93) TaxID=1509407 RepID=A0A0L1JI71_ASPN3|nr:uncharacterized protein ANOM_000027 [Aspergillus nomiae NRRL 13137]KNG91449.1 hypothetical protein ANOM_000027 [Aspergillus nomiae NRRL 13137]